MKTVIKYFWHFGHFRIEGQKQHNSDFQNVIFLCQKLAESFLLFFSLKNAKKENQLLLLTYFDNFYFYCTLLLKRVQFLTFNSKMTERPKIFLWLFL
jgi:hypothetical protein